MIAQSLGALRNRVRLQPRDIGAFAALRAGGMRFSICAYDLPGVGALSTVSMTAMLGLMRMETLVLTPLERDAPLLSCDLVRVAGRDTLLLELYDTQLAPIDTAALDAVKAAYAALPDHDLGTHWYDPLKLPPSLAKRGRKLWAQAAPLADAYLAAYLDLLSAAPPCARTEKQARVRAYVDGLLQNGGPSTDQFKKLIGAEQTAALFRQVIFRAED